jgi:hypothetical protein
MKRSNWRSNGTTDHSMLINSCTVPRTHNGGARQSTFSITVSLLDRIP